MHLEITHYRLHPSKIGKAGPDRPFRLVLLSDLHNACFDGVGRQIAEAVAQADPAALICAGDMLTAKAGRHEEDQAVRLIRLLSRSCPVYLIRGNHEQRMYESPEKYGHAYEQYLHRTAGGNVHHLDDETVRLIVEGMPLDLTGLTVPLDCYKRFGRRSLTEQMIREKAGSPDEKVYQLMAAHHPDYLHSYSAWGADLVLSGHVHGGIIRLPVLGGVFGATWRLFPPYTKGMYAEGKSRMILSAGLGAHTIPIRWGNPPQMIVLEFMPQ